jgi:hypothetical protein
MRPSSIKSVGAALEVAASDMYRALVSDLGSYKATNDSF